MASAHALRLDERPRRGRPPAVSDPTIGPAIRKLRDRLGAGEELGMDGLEAALAALTPAQQETVIAVLEAVLEGKEPTQDYVASKLGIHQTSAGRRLARVARSLPGFLHAALDIKAKGRKET